MIEPMFALYDQQMVQRLVPVQDDLSVRRELEQDVDDAVPLVDIQNRVT